MKRFITLFLASLMVLPVFLTAGCSSEKESEQVLRVCNCEDYIDESLLEDFEEETGIEVVYSTYGTNENLYNELVINPNSYDLVVPSEYMIEKLAVEGRLNKLDHSKIAGYEDNLSGYIAERISGIDFTVKSGETVLATVQRLKAAPGEMEKIVLPADKLKLADEPIVVSLEVL